MKRSRSITRNRSRTSRHRSIPRKRSPIKPVKSPLKLKYEQKVRHRTKSPVKKQRFGFKPYTDLTFSQKQKIVQEIEGKNIFIDFLGRFMEDDWDLGDFSRNPNITIEFVLANSKKDWSWPLLAINPAIHVSDILAHPELPWGNMSKNPTLTINFLLKHLNDYDWWWNYVTLNENISMQDISENPKLCWDWSQILNKKNLTIEFIENPYNFKRLQPHIDYRRLARLKNVTIDFIRKFSISPSLIPNFVRNTRLSLEDIMNNRELFNLTNISHRPDITPEFIQEHPEILWDWKVLSLNPHMTEKFVEENIDKGWDWLRLAKNPSITVEFLDKISHILPITRSRFASSLEKNPFYPLKFIETHMDWPWPDEYLSVNPNMTLRFVESHPEIQWQWDKLSVNPRIWYDYIHGLYTVEPSWTFMRDNIDLANGLYDKNIFEQVYDEYLYLQSGNQLGEILGDDITEGVIGRYLAGREMTRPRDRYRE